MIDCRICGMFPWLTLIQILYFFRKKFPKIELPANISKIWVTTCIPDTKKEKAHIFLTQWLPQFNS